MTPEERAQSIYETWEYHAAENGACGPELVTAIAQALCDHGNEKLEAAALIVEESACENFVVADRVMAPRYRQSQERHQKMGDEEVGLMRRIRALKDTTDTPETTRCGKCDDGWVCENHPDCPWPKGCDCGAGMPCTCTITPATDTPAEDE